jgi:hypothetical protein
MHDMLPVAIFYIAGKGSGVGVGLASFMPFSNSADTFSFALLNSRIPFPTPRISSGIFLPPNNRSTITMIRIHSDPPGMEIKNGKLIKDISVFLEVNK